MLTAAQQVSVRRFCGYGLSPTPSDQLDLAMASLTLEQEAVVSTIFLPSLGVLELALTGTSDTLDTQAAAVWTRNPQELAERSLLYRAQRLSLCRFLGVDPGLGIFDPILVVPDPGTGTGTGGGAVGDLAAIPFVTVV